MISRVVCRFSCGAASAVATKLALHKYGCGRVEITYCDPGSEHSDNKRFLADCERWFGKSVIVLKSEKYADTWAVWNDVRFITSAKGAPCTGMLKREDCERSLMLDRPHIEPRHKPPAAPYWRRGRRLDMLAGLSGLYAASDECYFLVAL